MRFTESKRKMPLFKAMLIVVVVAAAGFLCFCEFTPTPETVQKTIVFEAD